MKLSTNSTPVKTRYIGPKFEESESYKIVSLQVEENIKSGRKKEEKRQRRMNQLRELEKAEQEEEVQEVVNDTNDFDLYFK